MKKMMSVMISTGLVFLLSSVARAATVNESWNGGTGNWDTAGDWTPATVPNNGGGNVYAVTIDSSGTDNVTLDISPTIASLVLGGSTGSSTLQNKANTAETLTITGALTINSTGRLVVDNGSKVTAGANSTNSGLLDVELGSNVSVSGNLINSGTVGTNLSNGGAGLTNTLTVTGTLTNQAGAQLTVGNNNNTNDVANIGTLSNSGSVFIGTGATMNLTSQPSGITDVVSGSTFQVGGTFKAGANNGLANLASIEGELVLDNGQTTTAKPGSGTLTISNTGTLGLDQSTTLTVSGNLTNSGLVRTNIFNRGTLNDVLTVTGTFTNNAGATFQLGFNPTNDVANVGMLVNNGTVITGLGSTLNLTSQPNGITDVLAGSMLQVGGTFKAGANNGLAKLGSVEGELVVDNGQTTTATAGSGTLTVSSTGTLGLDQSSTLIISGNLTNSGTVRTNIFNRGTLNDVLTVTGMFTNNAGATFQLGFNPTNDVANIGTLSNKGTVNLAQGSTLNVGTLSNNSPINVEPGSTLAFTKTGTSTNSSAINVGSSLGAATLKIGANVTLSGNGKVILSNNASNVISGTSGSVLTNASTIQGSGNIGNALISVVNNGTISANQSTALLIDTNATGFTNNGTLSVSTGDTLDIEGGQLTNFNSGTSTLTGGTYSVSGGTLQLENATGIIVTDAAKISMTGSTAKFLNSSSANMLADLNTITSVGSFAIAAGFNFTTIGDFTNNGTLSIGGGTKFVVNLVDSLTNFNSSTHTLTGGTYIDSGVLQFKGANIQTIAANTSVTMSGAAAKIEDQTGAADGLTNFATNNGTFGIASGFNFTTGGNFTNNGTLNIGASTKFIVNLADSLTNFNGTTHTLTGGTYNVTGTLEFNNANIVTNGANLTLSGTGSQIINQSSANALASFATNNASFTLAGNRSFTTTGNFTNAGTLTINTGSTFSVGSTGVFTQSGGKTTDNGSLSASGGVKLNGGLLFGTGSITGGLTSSSAGTITPGVSSTATGILKDSGTYTQNSGTLDISIDGTTAGSQYDQFNPTKATLSGNLNISRPTGFVPKVGNTFKIMNYGSETGTFGTVNGLAINSTEHFAVTYQPTDVLLTVVSGALAPSQPAFGVNAMPASNFVPIEASISGDGRSSHMVFASAGGIRPTGAAELNTRSIPDHGPTFVLLLMAFAACGLFRWHSTNRGLI